MHSGELYTSGDEGLIDEQLTFLDKFFTTTKLVRTKTFMIAKTEIPFGISVFLFY